MKITRLHIAIASLACLSVVSLAGTTLGTMAWYAYSTRATMAYQGTAVKKTEQLQIGLLWDRARDAAYESAYEVSYEEVGEHSYYFMPAGTGFSAAAIKAYLSIAGCATDELIPVTTRAYVPGDDLILYHSPSNTFAVSDEVATVQNYAVLPFVFRIVTTVGGATAYVKDQNIWLTDATAAVSGSKNVKHAVRVHVHNPDGSDAAHQNYVLNPTAEAEGDTYVAGLLDLGGDGFYDYVSSPTPENPERMLELIYGDYTSSRSPAVFSEDVYDDINGTSAGDGALSTFNAYHRENVYGYSADYTNIVRAKAHYLSFADVKPEETYGVFSGGYPIAHTSNDANAIGHCTLSVYLEGWDHDIIDLNIGAKFNLGLQFEINRV